jgi:TolB-like protein/Tfp pilus assembly protein PilF
MSSIISGYEYDIFISYRQKDNKGDRWVSKFVETLRTELEATFKEDVSVYFDENPHDRLQETHNVDKSLEGKLKCLIFIPILSKTYCDSSTYAWQYEFLEFLRITEDDRLGRDVRLRGGNVASRILPIRINDLEQEDIKLFEKETGSVLRAMDFVFKTAAGVNRPLKSNEDHPHENLNKTFYSDQINKVANAIDEIIHSLKERQTIPPSSKLSTEQASYGAKVDKDKNVSATVLIARKSKRWMIITLAVLICAFGLIAIYKFIGSGKRDQKPSPVDKSIAVLPFVNDSPDKENEYFCNGMMEEILNQLQKISDLRVKARTSVEKYRNPDKDIKVIGHELGVSLIMEGSVRKIGDDLRITAQLIDAKTGDHLWSETYDGKYTSDIFEFQSNVAKKVAASLNVVITPKEEKRIDIKPTTEMLAHDLVMKGNEMVSKWHYTHDSLNLKLALNLFNQALEIDHEYIEALDGKNQIFAETVNYDSVMFYCNRIQEIDPDYSGGPAGKGLYYMYSNKPDSAFKYYQKAIELAPNDLWLNLGMGQLLILFRNEVVKGLPYYQKAYDLGGDSWAEINENIAYVYFNIGDYPKVLKYLKNSLSLRSECELYIQYDYILLIQGKYDEALHILDSICSVNACEQKCDIMKFWIYTMQKEFEKAEKSYNKAVNAGYKRNEDDDLYIAYLYNEIGRKKEALSILNNSIKLDENSLKGNLSRWSPYISNLRLAAAHAILDENKKALKYLSELEKSGHPQQFYTINTFPGFDKLRNDPEFKAIVKRIEDQRAAVRQMVREMEQRGDLHL